MSESAIRTQYGRIVFFQPRTGFCVDIGPTQALASEGPGTTEEYLVVDGSELAISRSHFFQVPVLLAHHIETIRLMKQLGCDVRMYALAGASGVCQVWDVPDSKIYIEDVNRGAKNFGGAKVTIRSSVFAGAIYQGRNLLQGIPFECTRTIEVFNVDGLGCGSGFGSGQGADLSLRSFNEDHFVGPYWSPNAAGSSVDMTGRLTLGSATSVDFSTILPLQGATLQFSGEFSLDWMFFDWNSSLLSSGSHTGPGSTDVLVPSNAWRFDINVTEASSIPNLEVVSPGLALDPRIGDCVDCSNFNATALRTPEWFD